MKCLACASLAALVGSVFLSVSSPALSQDLPHVLADLSSSVSASDSYRAIAPDGHGGAFLGGRRGSPGSTRNALLTRLSASGSVQWEVEFGATMPLPPAGFPVTEIWSVESDATGGVFVAGSVSGSGFAGPVLGGSDGFVAHFDALGALTWASRVGSAGLEAVIDLCADGFGGVFAVGSANGGSLGGPSSGLVDAFVARVDGFGALRFVTRYTQAAVATRFSSVTTDGAGGAICGGNTTQQNPPYDTVLTARYDGNGQRLWAIDDNSIDFAGSLVIADGSGGFFLGGSAYASSGPDQGLLERRDAAGQVLWSRTVGLCGSVFCSGRTTVESIELDDNGDLLVAGTSGVTAHAYLARFDAQGTLLAHGIYDPGPAFRSSYFGSVALDEGGRLMALGERQLASDFTWSPLLVRYAWTGLGTTLGTSVCPVNLNSFLRMGVIGAVGSDDPSSNAVTLWTADLPWNVVGIFLASQTSGFTALPGGSSGNLCLDGAIGRFNRPGEILSSGLQRGFYLDVDLSDFPSPTGSVAVLPGDTWYFQAWHRDGGSAPTSQFTSAIEVTFL